MAELLAHDVKLEEGFASCEQYGRLYWPPQGMLDYSCGIRGRRDGDGGGIQISNGNGFGLDLSVLAYAKRGYGDVSKRGRLCFRDHGLRLGPRAVCDMCGAVVLDVHGIAVDLGLGARLDAVGGLRLLALERLLWWGFLDGAVGFGSELVGGYALVEGQEVAIARRIWSSVVGAEPVSRLRLRPSVLLSAAHVCDVHCKPRPVAGRSTCHPARA